MLGGWVWHLGGLHGLLVFLAACIDQCLVHFCSRAVGAETAPEAMFFASHLHHSCYSPLLGLCAGGHVYFVRKWGGTVSLAIADTPTLYRVALVQSLHHALQVVSISYACGTTAAGQIHIHCCVSRPPCMVPLESGASVAVVYLIVPDFACSAARQPWEGHPPVIHGCMPESSGPRGPCQSVVLLVRGFFCTLGLTKHWLCIRTVNGICHHCLTALYCISHVATLYTSLAHALHATSLQWLVVLCAQLWFASLQVHAAAPCVYSLCCGARGCYT